MKKTLLIFFAAVIIVAGGAFYGGMKYGQSKNSFPKNFSQNNQQSPQGSPGLNGKGSGMNLINGEIIAKDDKSITVKLQNGGSKIIFFSDSTEISKTAEGSINDIEVGKQITVTGEQNSDGSYTAKTIQLSPRLPIPRNSE